MDKTVLDEAIDSFNKSCKRLILFASNYNEHIKEHKNKAFLAIDAMPTSTLEILGPRLYKYKDFIMSNTISDIPRSELENDAKLASGNTLDSSDLDILNDLHSIYPTLNASDKNHITNTLFSMLQQYALYVRST